MLPDKKTFGPGSLLADKYRLERMLGQGGMGTVWAAENVDIGRRVAIKLLHSQYAANAEVLARFRQEARAAAAIGHPGIVDVLDAGQTADGEPFLVMQYLEGETVGTRIERNGAMDPRTAAWIAGQVLEAIGAAHDRGILHRDLKPDNVFLATSPATSVKILDFGISKFRSHEDVSLTRTGLVLGTPSYMPPEQARGAKDVGPAADLYAIGAILYEMLAGKPAYDGESYNEVLAKILTNQRATLADLRPDLPLPFCSCVERLMASNPAERPANARAAAEELARACRDSELGGPAAAGPSPIPLVAVAEVGATFVRSPTGSAAPSQGARGWASAAAVGGVTLAALLVGTGAGFLRGLTDSFFPGLQGLAAALAVGGLGALVARRQRFHVPSAAALGALGAVAYFGAEVLCADFTQPVLVTGGWFYALLRGQLPEWLFAAIPSRGGLLGANAGDTLLGLSVADAGLAALAAPLFQRLFQRAACPACGERLPHSAEACPRCQTSAADAGTKKRLRTTIGCSLLVLALLAAALVLALLLSPAAAVPRA